MAQKENSSYHMVVLDSIVLIELEVKYQISKAKVHGSFFISQNY